MAVPHSMRSYQGSEQFSSRCTVQEPDVSIPFSLPTGTPRTNEDTNRRAGRLGAVKARLDFPQLVQTVQIQAVLQQSRGAPDTRHGTATSTVCGLTREGRTGPQHHQELLGSGEAVTPGGGISRPQDG